MRGRHAGKKGSCRSWHLRYSRIRWIIEYIPNSQSKYQNMPDSRSLQTWCETDALARARAEQEKIVRELEANKNIFQSIKGQRTTDGPNAFSEGASSESPWQWHELC
jgi:hypothetical protein